MFFCFAVRAGGRRVGRWLRRFFEWRLGCRARRQYPNPRASLFSALAWRLLSGAHTISRLSALWRRIQGHGTCTLWQTGVPRRDARHRAATCRWFLRTEFALLPPLSRTCALSMVRRLTARRRPVFTHV